MNSLGKYFVYPYRSRLREGHWKDCRQIWKLPFFSLQQLRTSANDIIKFKSGLCSTEVIQLSFCTFSIGRSMMTPPRSNSFIIVLSVNRKKGSEYALHWYRAELRYRSRPLADAGSFPRREPFLRTDPESNGTVKFRPGNSHESARLPNSPG